MPYIYIYIIFHIITNCYITFLPNKKWKMEGQVQLRKSRVVEVDSNQSWDACVSQAALQGSPIVVHFTAAWCMVSVLMNQYIEEYASTYPNVMFLRVDVDDVEEVAGKYDIKAMPTFMMMRGGSQLVERKIIGANPAEIRKAIEGLLQSTSHRAP